MTIVNTGLNTSVEYRNLNLKHAVRYFFTVTAVNSVGLFTTISSDGFVVDINKPSNGVVFNTAKHKDTGFQSLTSEFGVSWHGFEDHCSGIQNYVIALVKDFQSTSPLQFIPVGLQTTFIFRKPHLDHGYSYRAAVKAIDAAGHESDVVMSAPVTVDVSPPSGYQCGNLSNIEIVVDSKTDTQSVIDTFVIQLQENEIYSIHGTISNITSVNLVLQIDTLGTPIPLKGHFDSSFSFTHKFVPINTADHNFTLTYTGDRINDMQRSVSVSECNELIVNDSCAFEAVQLSSNEVSVLLSVMDVDSGIQKVCSCLFSFRISYSSIGLPLNVMLDCLHIFL